MSIEKSHNLKKNAILIAAFITYSVTAYYSKGYYHPDEHFQILEFANHKLGNSNNDQMPWEYSSQIRSSFQPWVAYILIAVFRQINVTSPFLITFLLRLVTGMLSIVAIQRFISNNINNIQLRHKRVYVFLSYFLWFLPFLNIRFSSEIWSGTLFLLATSYINSDKELSSRKSLMIGIFCGLAFLCRYQSAIMEAGLLAYLSFIKKESRRTIAYIIFSFFVIICFGILMDKLFYGNWTITFWNYFKVNILQNVASNFGTTSWPKYIIEIVNNLISPIGITILVLYLSFVLSNPRSLITFCTAPLLIIHLIIPHKEIRFLFPLINFISIILVEGYSCITFLFKINEQKQKTILTAAFLFLFSINLIALITTIFVAPENGRISIDEYVYSHFGSKPIKMYTTDLNDPFEPYSFLHQSFYTMHNITHYTISDYSLKFLNDLKTNNDTIKLLVFREKEIQKNHNLNILIKYYSLKRIYSGNYKWVLSIEDLYFNNSSGSNYLLYGH